MRCCVLRLQSTRASSEGGCPGSSSAAAKTRLTVGDDLRLFATTFAVGFLFVSVLISDRSDCRRPSRE